MRQSSKVNMGKTSCINSYCGFRRLVHRGMIQTRKPSYIYLMSPSSECIQPELSWIIILVFCYYTDVIQACKSGNSITQILFQASGRQCTTIIQSIIISIVCYFSHSLPITHTTGYPHRSSNSSRTHPNYDIWYHYLNEGVIKNLRTLYYHCIQSSVPRVSQASTVR